MGNERVHYFPQFPKLEPQYTSFLEESYLSARDNKPHPQSDLSKSARVSVLSKIKKRLWPKRTSTILGLSGLDSRDRKYSRWTDGVAIWSC